MRILVTAASKHEATTEIAKAIAAFLTGSGFEADILRPDEVTAVDGYDAVIVGSAVYAGRWLDPAKKFIQRFSGELSARPTWLFSSGPIGDPPKPDGEPPEVATIREQIHAREHRVFAGRLDRSRLSFLEKTVVGAVKAPDGDFRAWEEIRIWAGGIAAALRTEPVAGSV